jgi:pSer/pThr/pTyr-binding forkhead associated (FHA) protein
MPTLRELVDANARIKYESLANFIDSCPWTVFSEQATSPFLVGRLLYDGKIRKRKNAGISSSTLMFEPAADGRPDISTSTPAAPARQSPRDSSVSPGGITNAIYMVRRKLYSTTEGQNVISIGRSRENDVVIADYVISKQHAQIISFRDLYFLVDVGSTNGTFVNHRQLKPNVKVQLPMNATVSFGRLVFVFMSPTDLYRALRGERL